MSAGIGRSAVLAVLLALPACALERITVPGSGAPGLDGGVEERDAAAQLDAATIDATTPPEADAGDAAIVPIDGGSCVARCEENVAITCSGGLEVPMDCGVGAVCMADTGGARCVARTCVPGAMRCSDDTTGVIRCEESGLSETTEPCARGCDPGTSNCRPRATCGRDDDGTITTVESMRIELCGEGNDHDHDDRWNGTTCRYPAGGEDALLRLTVDRAGRYTFDVRDAAGGNDVDAIVYVRVACEDRETELGCDDDGGAAGRDALLVLDLQPGEYFVVVDSYDGAPGSTDCGTVELTVSRS
jgi:hypothetical protein